jgi:anti-anti-sigma regulatory factor
MDYEFLCSDDFLIIRLSGIAGVNERLSAREHLVPYHQSACRRIIVDLENINDTKTFYIVVGVLNTMKKEFQLLGGEVKLCALKPAFYRYFQSNRLDQIFDICQSIEQVKLCFEGKNRDS